MIARYTGLVFTMLGAGQGQHQDRAVAGRYASDVWRQQFGFAMVLAVALALVVVPVVLPGPSAALEHRDEAGAFHRVVGVAHRRVEDAALGAKEHLLRHGRTFDAAGRVADPGRAAAEQDDAQVRLVTEVARRFRAEVRGA